MSSKKRCELASTVGIAGILLLVAITSMYHSCVHTYIYIYILLLALSNTWIGFCGSGTEVGLVRVLRSQLLIRESERQRVRERKREERRDRQASKKTDTPTDRQSDRPTD